MTMATRNIIAVICLMTAIVAYRFEYLESSFGWSASTSQFAMLPFVLFSIFLFSFWGNVLPRYALILTVISAFSFGASKVSFHSQKPETLRVFVSPFLSDLNEAQSIRFSNLLEKSIRDHKPDLKILRISNPLSEVAAAQEFIAQRLADNPSEAAFVISGSPRWLSLSLSPRISESLIGPELEHLTSSLGLRVATYVSGTGLSQGFSTATLDYISRLIVAFYAQNSGQEEKSELYLSEASRIVEHWTSSTHRAYSLWLLGTLYLNRAFSGDRFEPAYLKCAVEYLNRSNHFIRDRNSPELLAAVLNNRGVANFLSYVFLGQKNLKAQAIKEFKVAANLGSKTNMVAVGLSLPAWVVAKENSLSFGRTEDPAKLFARRIRRAAAKKVQLKKVL